MFSLCDVENVVSDLTPNSISPALSSKYSRDDFVYISCCHSQVRNMSTVVGSQTAWEITDPRQSPINRSSNVSKRASESLHLTSRHTPSSSKLFLERIVLLLHVPGRLFLHLLTYARMKAFSVRRILLCVATVWQCE